MVRELSLEATAGAVVLAWHTGDQGLRLRVRGEADEVLLRCRCDRSHWIVREQLEADRVHLLVSCHNCGRRQRYVFEGAETRDPRGYRSA
ncbi:MAG: hypothetical protein ACT4OI_00850 [Methanobacteriota archaeon]